MRPRAPRAVLAIIVTLGTSPSKAVFIEIGCSQVNLASEVLPNSEIFSLSVNLLLEHDLRLSRLVKVPRCGIHSGQRILVKLLGFRNSRDRPRKLNSTVREYHVLSRALVDSHKDARVPHLATGCRFVTSILEPACFPEPTSPSVVIETPSPYVCPFSPLVGSIDGSPGAPNVPADS